MNKQFSLNEILADTWSIARKNIWIIMGFTAIQSIVFLIALLLLAPLNQKNTLAFFSNIAVGLIDVFFTVAIYQVFFKLIDEEEDPEFPDFLPNMVKTLNFIISKLLIGLVVVFIISTIAAIYFFSFSKLGITSMPSLKSIPLPLLASILVAIIYVTIRMCFILCFIVDQDSGVIESIKQSWILTKGHFWFLLLLFLVILGLNILGTMLLFIGLLFTIPFSSLIMIIAYRHMIHSYIDEDDILLEDPDNTTNGTKSDTE